MLYGYSAQEEMAIDRASASANRILCDWLLTPAQSPEVLRQELATFVSKHRLTKVGLTHVVRDAFLGVTPRVRPEAFDHVVTLVSAAVALAERVAPSPTDRALYVVGGKNAEVLDAMEPSPNRSTSLQP
ncbi:MAG: hypothetical protein ACKVPX_16080 [Myxococcaceae bacterium]